MKAYLLAKLEPLIHPIIALIPPKNIVSVYSAGRRRFLNEIKDQLPEETYTPPEELARTLWGIRFRSPIMNAAGMFKNGEWYETV